MSEKEKPPFVQEKKELEPIEVEKLGPEHLQETLTLLKKIWADNPQAWFSEKRIKMILADQLNLEKQIGTQSFRVLIDNKPVAHVLMRTIDDEALKSMRHHLDNPKFQKRGALGKTRTFFVEDIGIIPEEQRSKVIYEGEEIPLLKVLLNHIFKSLYKEEKTFFNLGAHLRKKTTYPLFKRHLLLKNLLGPKINQFNINVSKNPLKNASKTFSEDFYGLIITPKGKDRNESSKSKSFAVNRFRIKNLL